MGLIKRDIYILLTRHPFNAKKGWADALIIQAVAGALKVTIQIVESNQGFAPLTTVYPIQERNASSKITIGHIDECRYVSTTALQSNASISMWNELTNDTQSSRNKHIIMSIYAVCFSVIKSCTYWDCSTLQVLHEHACLFYEKCNVDRVGKMGCERLTIFMQSRVPLGPGKFHVVVLVIFQLPKTTKIQYTSLRLF